MNVLTRLWEPFQDVYQIMLYTLIYHNFVNYASIKLKKKCRDTFYVKSSCIRVNNQESVKVNYQMSFHKNEA